MGVLCYDQNELDKAKDLYEKALTISLDINGDNNPTSGIIFNNLGNIFKDKLDFNNALEYYKKAHTIFLKSFGEEHSNTKFLQQKLNDINDK